MEKLNWIGVVGKTTKRLKGKGKVRLVVLMLGIKLTNIKGSFSLCGPDDIYFLKRRNRFA